MIDKQFIVNLKGKDYPLWAGVLDAATKAGLVSLTTQVVQIPSEANGWLAVVSARAEFADGRVFEDLGDCSPKSCAPHLVAAVLRMASTRAKGRCLRDSLNVGQTMFEELPGDDEAEAPKRSAKPAPIQQRREEPPAAPKKPTPPMDACVACGAILTAPEINAADRYFGGRGHCTPCGKAELARQVAEQKAAKAA